MRWIRDEKFIRGDIPMTKFQIRILSIGILAIEKGDRLLDIGAGTGSISIEANLQGAEVWAVEKEIKGIQLLRANNQKFNTQINIIHGQAPKDCPDIIFNKCFIGGSGGKMDEIFSYLDSNLEIGGIVCGNFITLGNLNRFIGLLDSKGYRNVETRLIQVSTMDNIGLLRGQNPIFMVKGVKYDD